MVLLCMTPAMAAAVKRYQELQQEAGKSQSATDRIDDPTLEDPQAGNPISHFQLVEISKYLLERTFDDENHESLDDATDRDAFRLSFLLRGASFYTPPPKPAPAPTSEYTTLMARVRADEEARQYQRMLDPAPSQAAQSFYDRFPQAYRPAAKEDEEDDITFQDVQRQITLIINVLVSVVACAVAVWIMARHWRVEARLALSMGSSIVIAVAEVVVYNGYLRRLREAKVKEKSKVEQKEIIDTWIIEPRPKGAEKPQLVGEVLGQDPRDAVRLRKGRQK